MNYNIPVEEAIAIAQEAIVKSDHKGWFSAREFTKAVAGYKTHSFQIYRYSDTHQAYDLCTHLSKLGLLETHSGTPEEKGTYATLWRVRSTESLAHHRRVAAINDLVLKQQVLDALKDYALSGNLEPLTTAVATHMASSGFAVGK